jgi:thioredoxin 1
MLKCIFSTTLFLFLMLMANCQTSDKKQDNQKLSSAKTGEVVVLTDQTFKEKVFNYSINKNWKYEGNIPCIVDFYADWCGPCRRVSPILEEIAREYSGKIIIYKVNTDREQTLSSSLGITSLPTILFVPVTGQPQVVMGAYPKDALLKIVHDVLLKNQ